MHTDLISRSALQDKMHDECCGECESCKKYIWNGERSLCGLIDEAPTVPLPDFKEGYKQAILDGKTNYSRPKGKWIKTNDYVTCAYGCIDYVKCSCCKNDSLEEGDYCPNCGADMKEADNE